MLSFVKIIIFATFIVFQSHVFADSLESYQCKFDSTGQVINIKIRGENASVGKEDKYDFLVLKNSEIGVVISKAYLSPGVELEGTKQNDVGVLNVLLDKETGQFSHQYLGLFESTEIKRGECELVKNE